MALGHVLEGGSSINVSGVPFKYRGKMPDRPADSNAVEAEAYLSSGPSGDTDTGFTDCASPTRP